MSKLTIPKATINSSDPLIENTFFDVAKHSSIGSGNEYLEVEDDQFVLYKLLSREYDVKQSLDFCMVDPDKLMIIHVLNMYQLSDNDIKFDTLYDLVKDNKYCYLFFEEYLKNNEFKKEIIEKCIEIEYISDKLVNVHGDTALIWACSKGLSDLAVLLIDTFGDLCRPEYIDPNGNTALMCSYEPDLSDVAIKLIDTFGDLCRPEQVNINDDTALILACDIYLSDVAIKLIDTFGDQCKPEQFSLFNGTALFLACNKDLSDVAIKLIDTFGDKCKPEYVMFCEDTALIVACHKGLSDVALKLIDTFGDLCKPEYVMFNGDTALSLARKNNLSEVIEKLEEFEN